jgi:hypothetical protein
MFVKAAGPRSSLIDSGVGLEIRIPAARSWFTLLFLPVWLVGWAWGWWSAFENLFLRPVAHADGSIFLMVWMVGWTIGGLAALVTLLWMLAGHEVVRAETGALRIRKEIFGIGFTRTFDITQVKLMRYAPPPPSRWGFLGGHIAFDYGMKTYRLGQGIDEPEARQIAQAVAKRFGITAG